MSCRWVEVHGEAVQLSGQGKVTQNQLGAPQLLRSACRGRFLTAEELLLTLFRVAKNLYAKRLPSNHDAVKTHKCRNVSMLQSREQSLPF